MHPNGFGKFQVRVPSSLGAHTPNAERLGDIIVCDNVGHRHKTDAISSYFFIT